MRIAARLIRSVFVSLVLIICVSASSRVGSAPRAETASGSEDSTKGVEVKRDKDGFLEGRDYKMGGCWVILFVRVLPPAETVYFNNLADGWKKQQEALKKAGIVLSYKIMYTNMAHKNDYNVMLMTEYKDRATLDEAQQGAYDTIGRQISGTDEKVALAFRERANMRTLFGGKITREVILR